MNKNQKTQVLEYHYKQGKKLIKASGGIEALADKIKFKYGSLSIQDLNKLLYDTQGNANGSMKDIAQKKHPRVQSKAEIQQRLMTNR